MLAFQSYAVVGLGGSGLSAVRYLSEHGKAVAVTDGSEMPALAKDLPTGVTTRFGGIDGELLLAVDCIVISPGIDPRTPAIAAAKAQSIPMVSDVQLFIDALSAADKAVDKLTPVVAITGSNAKSTVTTLVGEMAKASGLITGVGGNIGTPALELLKIDGLQMVVLELSSFQLEHISHLGAAAATILNISADHLDRHDGMADYLAQKLRIFEDAKAAVICLDDTALVDACMAAAADARLVSTDSSLKDKAADFSLIQTDDGLVLACQDKPLISADKLLIKGKHNLLNALSALALGTAVGLSRDAMLGTLASFKGLPHRCEYVAEVNAKAYFNDSKGTNIGSTLAAIDGLGTVYGEGSLALILGGLGKGQDFSELADDVARWTDGVYLIGEDADKIAAGLLAKHPDISAKLHHVGTLDAAVSQAAASSAKVVLLSPACASFDQFKSYGDRGEQFVAMVNQLSA